MNSVWLLRHKNVNEALRPSASGLPLPSRPTPRPRRSGRGSFPTLDSMRVATARRFARHRRFHGYIITPPA